MKITVVGGTGTIGEKLVTQLRAAGHDTVVASRSTGVDVIAGIGLADALVGCETVIDVSNNGYGDADEMLEYFETGTTNLLAAADVAGVRHYVALSVVGTDRLSASGYFRAKMAQETLIAQSGMPFTIIRSAPFFEYIYDLVSRGDEDTIHVPPLFMRPVAAFDVAKALVSAATTRARNLVMELVGPDEEWLPALAEHILLAGNIARSVITDPEASYFGARIGGELLTGEHPRFASTSFDDWLRRLPMAA